MIADVVLVVLAMATAIAYASFTSYWHGYSARAARADASRARREQQLLDDLDAAAATIARQQAQLDSVRRHPSTRGLALVQGGAR